MNFTKYHSAGKDYIYCTDTPLFGKLTKEDISALCHRQKGVGADGIFTFYQNNTKTGILKGFSSNGKNMRDLSSASICAIFELFLTADITEYTFSSENCENFTVKADISAGTPAFICSLETHSSEGIFGEICRKTEIGNRILTLTPINFNSIYAVHFTDCREKLNIEYLGKHISRNSLFKKEANMILAQQTGNNSFDFSFYENKTGCPRPVISAFAGTALAACRNDICNYGDEISVSCNDNTVKVTCHDPESATIQCTCEKIFTGKT